MLVQIWSGFEFVPLGQVKLEHLTASDCESGGGGGGETLTAMSRSSERIQIGSREVQPEVLCCSVSGLRT